MKLTLKLSFILLIGILILLLFDGYYRIIRASEFFEADMRNDHAAYGTALARAISEVWYFEGKEEALKMVRRINKQTEQVKIVWRERPQTNRKIAKFTSVRTRQRYLKDPRYRGNRKRRSVVAYVERNNLTKKSYLKTDIPVLVNRSLVGTLHLEESLEYKREYIRDAIFHILASALTVLLLCSVLILGLGFLFAGRPIRLLVEQARRIGQGDFSGASEITQKDEIGELAKEMDLMSQQLQKAREQLEQETEERIKTLDQLRHADRLATVGKLASGIAHEMGTPLNVVSGRAKMIAAQEVSGGEVLDNARIIDRKGVG